MGILRLGRKKAQKQAGRLEKAASSLLVSFVLYCGRPQRSTKLTKAGLLCIIAAGREEAQNSQKQDGRPEKTASFFLCLLCIIAAGTGRANELWMKRNSRWGNPATRPQTTAAGIAVDSSLHLSAVA
ncbi:MAG TPA: hypothetical protein VN641_12540 [Urbifossiella sp.]|nr:hypothetical protein [Urbifossiella sp.]